MTVNRASIAASIFLSINVNFVNQDRPAECQFCQFPPLGGLTIDAKRLTWTVESDNNAPIIAADLQRVTGVTGAVAGVA